MIILIAVLILGVGYAAVSSTNLTLNGTANVKANADFTVVYDTTHTVAVSNTGTGSTFDDNGVTRTVVTGAYTSTSVATMTVWLDNTHRSASAVYKIDNNSSELGASLTATITNVDESGQNESYFEPVEAIYYSDANCTTALSDGDVVDAGDSVYLKVTVELARTPLDDITGATFTVVTTATPEEA
jgi:hypothetical protein